MNKTCSGYKSDGAAGQAYDQPRHDLENTTQNFGPGKSQCRDCYGAYARDWRAKRNVGGVPAQRRTGQRGARQVINLPDFRAPAMDGGGEGAEFVSDDDLATSRSHAFHPAPDLIETWAAVTNAAAGGSHPFNLIFLGPSGCGKTEAGQYLAALVGLPFTKVDAAAMTDPESWFGTREVVVEDGASVTSYRPSAFVLAIEEPGVLMIDEINRVRDEHRNVLLPLTDGTHQVTNPLTGDVVRKHPRCFIIMTGNRGLQFTGTYAMDPALLTRALLVEFGYADHAAEVEIATEASGCDDDVAELFVRFAEESRLRSSNDPDFIPISTREVISACKLVHHGLSSDTAAKMVVFNSASPEGGASSVRTTLEQIWAGIRTAIAGQRPCVAVSPNGLQCEVTIPANKTDHEGSPHMAHDAMGVGVSGVPGSVEEWTS